MSTGPRGVVAGTREPSPAATRVLVVDDDADFLAAVVRVLQSHGYDAEGTCSGADALVRLGESRFDAVLADVHMPGLNGLDVLRRLRRDGCDVPVLLLSGEPTLHSALVGIEEGAVAYLTKPVSRTSLIPALERAVGTARSRRHQPLSPPREGGARE